MLANLASQQKAPLAAIDFRIDADLASESIDQILAQAARQAQQTGNAVCLIAPTPLAIDRLNHWVAGLRASGIRLAPLSAMLH
ncbi:MAG: divergent polysaccharide deacetylase family protein [Alphaproteobacteria bacterium]